MFLDSSLLVDKEKFENMENDITCPICKGIIKDPYFCNKCQNNFCNTCIQKWEEINDECPFRCTLPVYTPNLFLSKIFSQLLEFKCAKGCEKIISYKDVDDHYKNCKNENFKEKYYECATQLEDLKDQIKYYNTLDILLDAFEERNTELENELNDAKIENNELKSEYDDANEKIEDLKIKLDDIKKIHDKYKTINDDLENKVNEIKKENNELIDSIHDLEKTNEKLEDVKETTKKKNKKKKKK